MFTFKKYQECQDAGVSVDYISDDLKNEFFYSVNVQQLDNRIFVVFTKHSILFCNVASQLEDWTVLASISLTDVKETGSDLLYFAKDVANYFPKIDEKETKEQLKNCLSVLCEIYKEFPFALKLQIDLGLNSNDKDFGYLLEKNKKQVEECFLKFCLLEFILTVDTHAEIFAIYPHFDQLRSKLRASKVYRLLKAKLEYYSYRYRGRKAKNSEELTYLVRTYSDYLMEPDFNKMLPPTYYDGNGLFYNPEDELEFIMEHHRTDENDDNELGETSFGTKDYESAFERIRSFFYTKHAVFNAAYGRKGKQLYRTTLICMLVSIIVVTASIIGYESWVGNFMFNHFLLFCILFLCIPIFFLIKTICKKGGNASKDLLFPRILVTLITCWLTIAVSEDLIKSQLRIKLDWSFGLFFAAIIIIVSIILGSKARHHSPFYSFTQSIKNFFNNESSSRLNRYNGIKVIPILIQSLFYALWLGIIIQLFFYSNLLVSSKTLQDEIYSEYFEDLESNSQIGMMIKESVDNYIVTYQQYLIKGNQIVTASFNNDLLTVTEPLDSANGNKTKISANSRGEAQFLGTKNWKEIFKAQMSDIRLIEELVNKLDTSLMVRKNLLFEINSLKTDTTFTDAKFTGTTYTVTTFTDTTFIVTTFTDTTFTDTISTVTKFTNATMIDSVMQERLKYNLSIIYLIRKELNDDIIRNTSAIFNNNNSDTLLKWSTYQKNEIQVRLSDGTINDPLTSKLKKYKDDKNTVICRELKFCSIGTQKAFFPKLLLVHTLVVLVLCFICQLFITDKSVVEPLR